MNRSFNRFFFANLSVIVSAFFIASVLMGIKFIDTLILVGLGVLTALVSSFIFKRSFLSPIKQMQKVTEKIAKGDFKSRLSLTRNDELGGLASNLNQMSVDLQNKIAQIVNDKNELQAIVTSMVEGVIVIGKDERIILLSAPVYDMLDLRSKDTIGKPYWEVIRNIEINSLLKQAIAHKKSLNKEITIISSQETHFNMQISCVLSDGNLSGVVAVFHDITELKKMERLRSEFVANVSHELKTPLTTIKGFVETLNAEDLKDKEKTKKFLEIIQKHTVRLENLVNDLLSLSSLESKDVKLNREKLQLSQLMDSVINFCRERGDNHARNITSDIEGGLPAILADRSKIEQVFINLLENAIKFTPPEGLITIHAARDGGFIRIDFKDTGIGIAPEHLPRIFERFYRVDKARSRDLGGTGLGLSIVKHIVSIHNGKVSVQSEPGKGSVFSVFLPHSPS